MDPFEILPYSAESLYSALSSRRFSSEAVSKHSQARYLHRYLTDLDAKSLLVESEYVDGDYLDDFAQYYVKCFASYPRRCRRLHFFSIELQEPDFKQIVSDPTKGASRLADAYLGFIVARPLPLAVVGRTVLRTYNEDGGRRHYKAIRSYTPNVFGLRLPVASLPFQEQDTVLAACATVALWSCFHKLADLFGTPTPSPAEITRIAAQVELQGRPIPSDGLNVSQMCHAIRAVGLEPELIPANKTVPLASLIYGYLHFGLPVILIIRIGQGLHAVTVNGYSLGDNVVLPHEVAVGESCAPLTGLRIDEFYAHDDQIGPFSRLKVGPSETVGSRVYPVVFNGSWENPATGDHLTLYPEAAIVPVYHKIRLSWLALEKWVERLHAVVDAVLQDVGDFHWDIHLTTTNDYKSQTLRQARIPDELRASLLLRGHPRFIWRTQLVLAGEPVLELLADATEMRQSMPVYEVIWHSALFGRLVAHVLTASATRDRTRETLTEPFWRMLYEDLRDDGLLSETKAPESP